MPDNKSHTKHFRELISDTNDSFSALYKKSLAILSIQNILRSTLGPALAQHMHVANLNPEYIVIFTENQSWATKLRFRIPEILKITRMHSGYKNLETVRVKVSPALITTSSSDTSDTTSSLSPATTRLLVRVAENIDDDALQTALLKLSRNC